MQSVCQSRKVQHAKHNEIMGFSEIAGVVTVSARKLTATKLKQCQQLATQKHRPDGTALILLSSHFMICVLRNYRCFFFARSGRIVQTQSLHRLGIALGGESDIAGSKKIRQFLYQNLLFLRFEGCFLREYRSRHPKSRVSSVGFHERALVRACWVQEQILGAGFLHQVASV
jgi:hypothetical protein